MKRILRIIASVLALSLMFVFLACNVFAASTGISGQWRGNSNGTTISSPFAVLENKNISVSSELVLAIDSGTAAHTVTAKVFLRRSTWYGYETVMTQTLYNGVSMSNTSTSIDYERCSYTSSTTAPATGEYYVVGQIKGASNAFASQFSGTVTYST